MGALCEFNAFEEAETVLREAIGRRWSARLVYDRAAMRQLLIGFGSFDLEETADLWWFRFDDGAADEACVADVDADADGLAGCDDPGCWATCAPSCFPGADAAACAAGPACGDDVCTLPESCRSCPDDCGPCAADVCGDGFCDPPEDAASCVADCG